MKQLKAEQVGKKFKKEWVFKDFTYNFSSDEVYAIIGANGSGKSTLLQILSGSVVPTIGNITFEGAAIEHLATSTVMASPALELIEEFTLAELVSFHSQFKTLSIPSAKEFSEKIQLKGQLDKQLKHFSSGMRQRVKLALAFYDTSDIVFLDEPTSNLDQAGVLWFQENLDACKNGKLVIISSNQPYEYEQATKIVSIEQYKPGFQP